MDLIKIAETNKLRLLALVNDIFDMEKIEAGQLGYAFEPIDLSTCSQRPSKPTKPMELSLEDDFF